MEEIKNWWGGFRLFCGGCRGFEPTGATLSKARMLPCRYGRCGPGAGPVAALQQGGIVGRAELRCECERGGASADYSLGLQYLSYSSNEVSSLIMPYSQHSLPSWARDMNDEVLKISCVFASYTCRLLN